MKASSDPTSSNPTDSLVIPKPNTLFYGVCLGRVLIHDRTCSWTMHIVDGILSFSVLLAGSGGALMGISYGLKTVTSENVLEVSVYGAMFFLLSLIFIPLAFVRVHFLFLGLFGILLGWTCFPVIAVTLFIQASFFGFGGITTIGVNTLILAFPAVLIGQGCCGLVLRFPHLSFLFGMFCGTVTLLCSMLMIWVALIFSDPALISIAQILFLISIPFMLLEGLLVGFLVRFLRLSYPHMFSSTPTTSKL